MRVEHPNSRVATAKMRPRHRVGQQQQRRSDRPDHCSAR